LTGGLPSSLKKGNLHRARQDVQVPDALALVQTGVNIRGVSNRVRVFFDATAIRLKQQVSVSHPG
jgi:hypothetical protein